MAPRFSIVIPCYEQGAFVGECLASVQAQTLAPHQVIVVDDGSRDPFTIARLDGLCRPPIVLLRQANAGLPAARNAGIRRAGGDWVIPLDADDQLTPDALAVYAEAIARAPEVDIWYPDIQHFGLDDSLWESPDFCRWRMLWTNQMVGAGSAVRKRLFDEGLAYDETLRAGYEDWALWIDACCQRGQVARALHRAVFRYRRWGWSMLAQSNARADEIKRQLRERLPIYRDQERLRAWKRKASPFFAVRAGATVEAALAGQTFEDARCVRELSAQPGRVLVGVLDEVALASALLADRFLLEKLAQAVRGHHPLVLWLAAVADAEAAHPGLLLDEEGRHGARAVAWAIPLSHAIDHEALLRAPDPDALQATADAITPGRTRAVIVGAVADRALPPLPPPRVPSPSPPPAAPRDDRWYNLGHGASRLLRGLVGPRVHDRLWQLPPLARVRPPAPEPKPSPPPPLFDARARRALVEIAADEPLEPRAVETSAPGLVILAPWIVHGGADRAVVDLLHGLHTVAPGLRRYLVTTEPVRMTWAREIAAASDGVLNLAALAPGRPHEALAEWIDRLQAQAVLIANAWVGYDALPAIRRRTEGVRVVAQLHGFDRDPKTGRAYGHPVHAASRYNNLIDAYAPISDAVGRELCADWYVSPTKVRAIRLGIDVARFATARRPRLERARPRILWLGRLSAEKDPLMVVALAQAWRAAGRLPIELVVAGGGPLAAEMRRAVGAARLDDTIKLAGAVADPVPLYAEADLLLLTSRYEGIPVVIYEAIAAGLPIVTPIAKTSIPEVLSAADACFVDDGRDPAAYVRAIASVLADRAEARARAERLADRAPAEHDRARYARETLALLGLTSAPARRLG